MNATEDALRELVRLKTLRDDLGVREKAGTIEPDELKRELLRYGREKKIAWARARSCLGMT